MFESALRKEKYIEANFVLFNQTTVLMVEGEMKNEKSLVEFRDPLVEKARGVIDTVGEGWLKI